MVTCGNYTAKHLYGLHRHTGQRLLSSNPPRESAAGYTDEAFHRFDGSRAWCSMTAAAAVLGAKTGSMTRRSRIVASDHTLLPALPRSQRLHSIKKTSSPASAELDAFMNSIALRPSLACFPWVLPPFIGPTNTQRFRRSASSRQPRPESLR